MNGVREESSSAAPALLSTENDDGTFALVALRIRWELGPVVCVSLPARGRTARNLAVRPDVVFNLPQAASGAEEGACAGPPSPDAPWTEPSELVRPPRLLNCPVQLEARRVGELRECEGAWTQMEAQVLRVHADPRWVLPLGDHRIDLSAWCPPVHDFRPSGGPPQRAVPAPARQMAQELGRRFPGG